MSSLLYSIESAQLSHKVIQYSKLHNYAVSAAYAVYYSSKEMGFLNPNFPLSGESGGAVSVYVHQRRDAFSLSLYL